MTTEEHKVECQMLCNNCDLPADATCEPQDSGSKCVPKSLKKAFVPQKESSMKLYCCAKLEVKAPLTALDYEKECKEKGVFRTIQSAFVSREEVTDGTKTYLCKQGTFFKLRLRMKDKEIDPSKSGSSSDSASPSATATMATNYIDVLQFYLC